MSAPSIQPGLGLSRRDVLHPEGFWAGAAELGVDFLLGVWDCFLKDIWQFVLKE